MKNFFYIIFIYIILINPSYADDDKEEKEEREKKYELGFWLGASNPMPGTRTSNLLNTTLGFGLFGRLQWPYSLYTEVGGSFANYLSGTERRLLVAPLYTALCYKLPWELPVSIFLKGGGGTSYVVARPANTATWDPMAMMGLEVSFVAGKRVRIGLRMDYYRIIERYKKKPFETQLDIYSAAFLNEPRLSDPNYYNLHDAEFFHFALMVSFIL